MQSIISPVERKLPVKRFIAVLSCAAAMVAVPVAGATAAPAANKTIVQIAAANPNFSTLVKVLKETGLVSVLSGKTDYTVFAPTNAAFAKVPPATLKALVADKAKLKSVLLYHVVSGSVPASKVVKLKSVTTVEGQKIAIRVSGTSVYVNQAKVIQTNIHASNGIIHAINAVLLPPAAK
jgi:uncharacterized surface protein with fasciclin (FAS1) repeats